MMRMNAKRLSAAFAGVGLLALAMGGAPPANADEITIVSWGGKFQDAQRLVYFAPFAKESGITVLEDEYNGTLATIEAQVKSGNPTWDIIGSTMSNVGTACNAGLFVKIDYPRIGGKEQFFDGLPPTPCGVPHIVSSVLATYNAAAFPADKQPSKLADFYDLKNFPGRRGISKHARSTLEMTLIATGVSPDKLYEVLGTEEGVARAYKKLDTIKDSIVFFEAWSQPAQLMNDGEVTMTMGTNARVAAAAEEHGKPFKLIWDGASQSGDYWSIVAGSNVDGAYEFLKYSVKDEPQAEWPKHFRYSPTVKSAIAKIPPHIAKDLVSGPGNDKNSYRQSVQFWAEHLDDYEVRFSAWAAK
jgi:putative spermidine/putrescine transport system substrate-binding protein